MPLPQPPPRTTPARSTLVLQKPSIPSLSPLAPPTASLAAPLFFFKSYRPHRDHPSFPQRRPSHLRLPHHFPPGGYAHIQPGRGIVFPRTKRDDKRPPSRSPHLFPHQPPPHNRLHTLHRPD